MPEKESKTQ